MTSGGTNSSSLSSCKDSVDIDTSYCSKKDDLRRMVLVSSVHRRGRVGVVDMAKKEKP